MRRLLRHRWISNLVLVVLLALTGAAVLTAWAGARRTETAFPRMLAATGAEDASVSAFSDLDAVDPDVVAAIDGVTRTAIVDGYAGIFLDADGAPDFEAGIHGILVPRDGALGRGLAGFLVTEGRLPALDRPDEVLVNRTAENLDLGVGAMLTMCVADLERLGEPGACEPRDLQVVGIGISPADVVVNEQSESGVQVIGSPAFSTTVPASFRIVVVDLQPGADVARFSDEVLRNHPGGGVSVQTTELREAVVSRAVDPYVRALTFFTAVLALTALGILGPALVRSLTLRDDEQAALGAIGFETRQRIALGIARGALLGVVAASVAIVAGIALSGLFPVGPVRDADPDTGPRVDTFAIAVVGTVIVVLAIAAGIVASRPRRPHAARRSAVADRLAKLGAPPPAVIGVQTAFRSPTATGGALTAVTSTAVAVAAVASALVFGAGLSHLLGEPVRFGFAWDAVYQAGDAGIDEDVVDALRVSPLVDSVASGTTSMVTADGLTVSTLALDDIHPDPGPVVLDGRLPGGPEEVAIGRQTLDRLDKGIGDQIELLGESGTSASVTVVGETLLPINSSGDDYTVGEGMFLDAAAMDELGGGVGFALLELTEGTTTGDVTAALGEELGFEPGPDGMISGPNLTGDLRSYDQVRWVPLALASLLAILGLGVLTHALVTSGRANRHDVAVLRAIGFRRGDVVRTTVWQGGAVAVACLVIGLPLGIAFGRRIWEAFAESLGVVPAPVTPTLGIIAVAVGTLLVAVIVACVGGLRSARRTVATLLRVE